MNSNLIHDDSSIPRMVVIHTFSVVDPEVDEEIAQFEIEESRSVDGDPGEPAVFRFHLWNYGGGNRTTWKILGLPELPYGDFDTLLKMCIDLLAKE